MTWTWDLWLAMYMCYHSPIPYLFSLFLKISPASLAPSPSAPASWTTSWEQTSACLSDKWFCLGLRCLSLALQERHGNLKRQMSDLCLAKERSVLVHDSAVVQNGNLLPKGSGLTKTGQLTCLLVQDHGWMTADLHQGIPSEKWRRRWCLQWCLVQ